MKKIISILFTSFFLLMSLTSVYAENLEEEPIHVGISSHVYANCTVIHGSPTVGGSADLGLDIDRLNFSAFLRYQHFFAPLGSSTGKLAMGEEMTEIGIAVKLKVYELNGISVSAGISAGWYQQWLMMFSNGGTYNMINNGIMLRPETSIGWKIVGPWKMELGVFYQTAVYPEYNGYDGWGIFLKLI